MKKRILELVEGVDNVELFYDLIFVYCISVITGVAHHHGAELVEPLNYLSYLLPLLTILQIWFYTTLLMNRYGSKTASDYVCLFINMFLLYYMASAIGGTEESDFDIFDTAWALVLLNLIVHWLLKWFRYENIDRDDRAIIFRTVAVIAVQLAFVIAAIVTSGTIGRYLAIAGLLIGIAAWAQARVYRRKPSQFAHLTERCVLLIIITFGETVVAIATYMQTNGRLYFPVLVFALVVGLFLIYNYEYDNMLDHDADTDGMTYMTINGWIIVVVSNLTVALEFMPEDAVPFLPKSIYLTACLVLYLLTSFALNFYSKLQYRASLPYTLGRLVACAIVIIAALATGFDPRITLAVDVVAVYGALLHEWMLFHTRTNAMNEAQRLGVTREMIEEAGYGLETTKGRRTLGRDMRAFLRQQGGEGTDDASGEEG